MCLQLHCSGIRWRPSTNRFSDLLFYIHDRVNITFIESFHPNQFVEPYLPSKSKPIPLKVDRFLLPIFNKF